MTARLDRIEGILEQLALDRVADRQDINQLRATVEAQVQEATQLRSSIEAQSRDTAELRSTTAELRSSIEAQSRDTAELRSTVTSLLEIAEIHQQNFEAMQRNFEMVLTEIRGLRTESQRILEYLFGQQQQGS